MDLDDITGDIGRYTRDSILVTSAESCAAPEGPAILWCNAAFTRLTGYGLDEIRGQTPRILQGADTPRKPLDKVRAALEAWRPVQTVVMNYTRAGAPFWAELSIAPVADETGWYRYWVAVQRDVTDRIRREQHLKARHRRLQESELALQEERLRAGWWQMTPARVRRAAPAKGAGGPG